MINAAEEQNKYSISETVKDFDGAPLKGPNSLILSHSKNIMYFTDSGAFGQTSIENPTGSLFAVDLSVQVLMPILYKKLAYPTCLALSLDEKSLFVAETCNNRVLRVFCHSSGVCHTSVFKQFCGRLGPTGLAVQPSTGHLFVARYDFAECQKDGIISVLNEQGELEYEISVNDHPEISGLYFSKVQ